MIERCAVVGDRHYGISNLVFLDNQIRFDTDVLIPYLLENKIKHLILEGDIFDTRKSIDVQVGNRVLDLFSRYEELDIQIYICLGNHDTALKNTNEVNSLRFLEKFKNIKIFSKIEEIEIIGLKFLFVPWQYDLNNYIEFVTSNHLDHIQVCVGHFDTIGAKYNSYKNSEVGFDKKYIMRFPLVFSGHYHSMSFDKHNGSELIYTGVPLQLNRSDKNETKGFFVLDNDMKYEFVENTQSIKFIDITFPEEVQKEQINNNIVDLHFLEDVDTDQLENYKEMIWKLGPISVTPRIIPKLKDNEKKEIKFKNLKELLDEYIETLELDENIKPDFNLKINELFETNFKEI